VNLLSFALPSARITADQLEEKGMSLTRRNFIASLAAAAAAIQIDARTGMPMRSLGSTGQTVSLIAFGGGSRWYRGYKDREAGLEALDRALKAGVNYVDSGASYGDGLSEQWIGEYLKTHKKDFFLVTKVGGDRSFDDSMRIIERSLKNLGVNQVDLLHIHMLGNEDDLAKIEAPDGQLKAVQRAKEQKLTRFIGITSHTNPLVLKTALERHSFDSTQMALNIAQMGIAAPSDKAGEGMTGGSGFEMVAMPVALKKKMGLTAMKVFAQDKLVGKAAPEILLRYALSLPIAAASIGMPKPEHIDFNVSVARSFKPLSREEMRRLPASITPQMRAAIDGFFADHIDC
jgi:aryl-alcohol dehydrogenase-like predicted oxidoreductase